MGKDHSKGFLRLNPQSVKWEGHQTDTDSLLHTLDEEGQDKLRLAKKLIDGEKMTKTEKRKIYKYLTGNDAPESNKKGRHTELYRRDIDLAWDYLKARAEWTKKAGDVRKELAKKYNLPGEIAGNITHVLDDTFYKAFNNGLAALEFSASEWNESIKIGFHDDMKQKKRKRMSANAKQILNLIKIYKQKKKKNKEIESVSL